MCATTTTTAAAAAAAATSEQVVVEKPTTTTTTSITTAATNDPLQILDSNDVSSFTSQQSWLTFCTSLLVWPAMLTLPLLLTSPYSPTSYQELFPAHWYEYDTDNTNDNTTHYNPTPKPLGLCLGILAVAIGQVATWIFFYWYKYHVTHIVPIQTKGAPEYEFWEGLKTHITQPEGFVILITYLSVTWMCHLMPKSYYSFEGGIHYGKVLACLLIQDCIQYGMHRLEHEVSPTYYQKSHKPHHKFINPRMFDAFNGSLTDTICMITIPLFLTANIMRNVNVWTYMAFGSSYACWLTLIHSEYIFPWDLPVFKKIGFGTPADHHVHHKFFKYNFGHLFVYWDCICGTYRDPESFGRKAFNQGV